MSFLTKHRSRIQPNSLDKVSVNLKKIGDINLVRWKVGFKSEQKIKKLKNKKKG